MAATTMVRFGVLLLLSAICLPVLCLRTCHLDEFHYEYTECDSSGGRWRVSVPKQPGLCTPANSPGAPLRGRNCTFACNPGEFLDIQGDQQCHSCPAGTYSLGGGLRFDEWSQLPSGFAVKTDSRHTSWMMAAGHIENCSKSQWTPRGGYIMSHPNQCPSSLLFSAKLVRPGKVSFEYQYTDPDVIFHFSVQNEQCQALDKDKKDKWPKVTGQGKWSTVVVDLKSGMTVLQWKTFGSLTGLVQDTSSPILIRKIEVTGVAYTSKCNSCPDGTYSSGGSSFCQPCSPNTFAKHGAVQCVPCPSDKYSGPGANDCLPRPPCDQYDYYRFQEPCDDSGKTRISYKWIEPKICSEAVQGSVSLPSTEHDEDCPPCNHGMIRVNQSHCDFCKQDQYVDYKNECHNCPMSTAPIYGLDYMWWNTLPPNVSSHCIALGLTDCSSTAGWITEGDHVRTIFGKQDHNVFLVLTLKLPGFKGEPALVDGKPVPLGKVIFEMEMDCTSPCQLLLLSDASGRNAIIDTWENTFQRTRFTKEMYSNESFTLTWAFQPDDFSLKEEDHAEDFLASVVRIYTIQVTNTLGGGSTRCETCPEGKTDNGCVPCPDGYYIDNVSQRCVACPQGYVLPSKNAWGRESCKPCGHGLHPVDGTSCQSDCRFVDDEGRTFDFSSLEGIHFVSGSRLFMASGAQYYHGFNLSLCHHAHNIMASCVNNVTEDAMISGQTGGVQAMVCRSTLVPDAVPGTPVISTQPVSLGVHLTKIVTNISLQHIYESEGFPSEGTERDIHFYYESGSPTSACPKGRTSIISLQCDPTQPGQGEISLPPKCSDGTCDGCLFHFLWKSRLACPTCRREDYQVVRGECVDGEQEIHYFPPAHCLHLPASELTPTKKTCEMLPFAVLVAIPVSVGVALILIVLLIYCWSRNKNLEYKYSKLVETSGGRDGELPAADTCGMEDDEEDVHYADASSSSIMSRIRNKFSRSNKQDDDNPFVAVKMSETMTLT